MTNFFITVLILHCILLHFILAGIDKIFLISITGINNLIRNSRILKIRYLLLLYIYYKKSYTLEFFPRHLLLFYPSISVLANIIKFIMFIYSLFIFSYFGLINRTNSLLVFINSYAEISFFGYIVNIISMFTLYLFSLTLLCNLVCIFYYLVNSTYIKNSNWLYIASIRYNYIASLYKALDCLNIYKFLTYIGFVKLYSALFMWETLLFMYIFYKCFKTFFYFNFLIIVIPLHLQMNFLERNNLDYGPLLYELASKDIITINNSIVDMSTLKSSDYLIPLKPEQYLQVPPAIYILQLNTIIDLFEGEGILNPEQYVDVTDLEKLTSITNVEKLRTLTNNFDPSHLTKIISTYVYFFKLIAELIKLNANRAKIEFIYKLETTGLAAKETLSNYLYNMWTS